VTGILRACADWRVIAILVAAGAGVVPFAPNPIAAVVPLLIVAACPLLMLVMMRTMSGHASTPTPGQVLDSADRPSQLRERLAAARLEQQRLEWELARLDSVDRVQTADVRGGALAADVRAEPD